MKLQIGGIALGTEGTEQWRRLVGAAKTPWRVEGERVVDATGATVCVIEAEHGVVLAQIIAALPLTMGHAVALREAAPSHIEPTPMRPAVELPSNRPPILAASVRCFHCQMPFPDHTATCDRPTT